MATGSPGRDQDVAQSFKDALRGVASSVSVITARVGSRTHGMTATAVMPVSMDPPALAICINQSTLLHDLLTNAETFCVNFLDETHEAVSAAFSGGLAPDVRFETGRWKADGQGLRYLEGARASIFCDKVTSLPFGTHTLFIGQVFDARGNSGNPLVYHNAAYCSALPLSQRAPATN